MNEETPQEMVCPHCGSNKGFDVWPLPGSITIDCWHCNQSFSHSPQPAAPGGEWEVALNAAAAKEEIYEPKYGGKDHSGYGTMMLYEVNGERSECFEKGAEWAKLHFLALLASKDAEILRLRELLKQENKEA